MVSSSAMASFLCLVLSSFFLHPVVFAHSTTSRLSKFNATPPAQSNSTATSSTSTYHRSETKLIIGISITTFASVVFFGVWHFRRRRSMAEKTQFGEDDIFASLPGQPRRFNFRELQEATAQFSHKLGVGGFGSVYRGTLRDGSKVAVKQLECAKTTQGLKEFRAEVIALSNINHQNLVHLRGFCAEGSHRLLVYEYVSRGSLDTWLFRTESPLPHVLDWKTRLTIAIHTARGLCFLHEQCRHRIIHLDIKPQNILLDDKFVAKLSDFGLSRLINGDETSAITRMRGTPGYMAPECLLVTNATEKSDVYSFGMVLLEVVSGRKNVDISRLTVHNDKEGWYLPAMASKKYDEGRVEEIVDRAMQLDEDELVEAKRVIETAFWCIQDEPSSRPSMGRVVLMLEGHTPVSHPPISFHFRLRFIDLPSTSSDSSKLALAQQELDIQQHQREHQEEEHETETPKSLYGSPMLALPSDSLYGSPSLALPPV